MHTVVSCSDSSRTPTQMEAHRTLFSTFPDTKTAISFSLVMEGLVKSLIGDKASAAGQRP